LRLYLRCLPRWILTVLALIVVTPILAFPVMLLSLWRPAERYGVWTGRTWALAVSKAMGLTFSLQGAEKVVPGASYIIAPSHQGNADILALMRTLPMPFRWVIKKELLRIPFFGSALGGIGSVAINRSNREQSVKSIQEASEKLKNGWSILIYPEGTRTPDGHLLPFKKGAFMLAVQTGVPILPVTQNGAFKVLPKKRMGFRPGHITVVIGDPISTEGLTEADVPELMEKTRREISRLMDFDYDPFDPRVCTRLKEQTQ
jgi:1-acyl-sn-glycerol-3-phosphate acyltransferase